MKLKDIVELVFLIIMFPLLLMVLVITTVAEFIENLITEI